MARLTPSNEQRARDLIALYPNDRSALIPILHLAQSQEGYLSAEIMVHVGEMLGLEAAEVRGTASFYDMFFFEPVGRNVVAVCTNIACMLEGAYELIEHIEDTLGIAPGGTSEDGQFTLEDAECLALCGNAPCMTVNWRYFGSVTPERFDTIADQLRSGELDDEVPPHGTLSRVRRTVGVPAAGHSVNSAGGPLTPHPESSQPSSPATEATDGAFIETRLTTPAVVALDGPGAGSENK